MRISDWSSDVCSSDLQDVGLRFPDTVALVLALLTCIASKGRPQSIGQPGLRDELIEFLDLAVGERVHRVDDDCARTRRLTVCPSPNRRIDDGYEEAEGLAGTGAGRDDKTLTTGCFAHRLGLMPVQSDRLPACAEHGGRLPSHRSEEHTSELQSLMRISYAVF